MSDTSIVERPAHQQRVLAERLDLKYKVDRLRTFRDGASFKSLDILERSRLVRQLSHMESYLAVLDERIAAFEPPL